MDAILLSNISLGDEYARALPELAEPSQAARFSQPEVLILNDQLANDVGLDPHWLATSGAGLLTGGQLPEGANPVAQAYAGHQFGAFVPQLGDGRALLLGELTTTNGTVVDLHLKGSGPTRFARGGDGYAAVGPMLREYLVSEALHALGVPTSRSLAVTTTGMRIRREVPLPGAVLARIASSHIRVGTFQFARYYTDESAGPGDHTAHPVLRHLADFSMHRHYPDLETGDYVGFYHEVVAAQARLVAQWMGIGFVHGVMNTDNTTISGETIDYGPCAFLDTYRPGQMFSSIDHQGRYAYGNQPAITEWNLARLGESLLPLLAGTQEAALETAQEVLGTYREIFNRHWRHLLARKLGLSHIDTGTVNKLGTELLALLEGHDWTNSFRLLTSAAQTSTTPPTTGDVPKALAEWIEHWLTLDPDAGLMAQANPAYIPRNHLVERALNKATSGDVDEFKDLLSVVTDPYITRPGLEAYTEPDPHGQFFQTFCGT